MNAKPKIYIGCSLTQAPLEFKEEVESLKDSLREKYEILDFVGLEAGTSRDVFKHDSKCVLESDLFVAICDFPSIGLGIELGIAYQARKEILIVSKKGAKITRMVLGMESSEIKFLEYQDITEILTKIEQLLPL